MGLGTYYNYFVPVLAVHFQRKLYIGNTLYARPTTGIRYRYLQYF